VIGYLAAAAATWGVAMAVSPLLVRNAAIIVPNAVAVLVCVATIAVAVRYR
jgi:hypothetical protein